MGLVVVVDLGLQEVVGVIMILDFLEGQETNQAPLKRAEESFNFAFGLRRGSDAVIDAQGAECALELGLSVQSVLGGGMSKEAQAVGIEAGWAAVLFERRAQQAEMTPGGVLVKTAGHDFAGVVIGR